MSWADSGASGCVSARCRLDSGAGGCMSARCRLDSGAGGCMSARCRPDSGAGGCMSARCRPSGLAYLARYRRDLQPMTPLSVGCVRSLKPVTPLLSEISLKWSVAGRQWCQWLHNCSVPARQWCHWLHACSVATRQWCQWLRGWACGHVVDGVESRVSCRGVQTAWCSSHSMGICRRGWCGCGGGCRSLRSSW